MENIFDLSLDNYLSYLRSNKNYFDQDTFKKLVNLNYYHPNSEKCPHDGTILRILIEEPFHSQKIYNEFRIDVQIDLLNDAESLILQYFYENVRFYNFSSDRKTNGYWNSDRFCINNNGFIEHLIFFDLKTKFKIECSDFFIKYKKFDASQSSKN